MSEISEMRKRHEIEIKKLQDDCLHEIVSRWMDECWAPAHSSGFQVKYCLNCEKSMVRRTSCRICGIVTENYKPGLGTKSRPFGVYYCEKCIVRTDKEIKSDDMIKETQEKLIKKLKL